MQRLCRACGSFHRRDAWPPDCIEACAARSSLPAPSIRPDGMTATLSHADGRIYDGKSAYYASVRRAGCEIVGDDRSGSGCIRTAEDLPPPNIGADLRRAIEELSSR